MNMVEVTIRAVVTPRSESKAAQSKEDFVEFIKGQGLQYCGSHRRFHYSFSLLIQRVSISVGRGPQGCEMDLAIRSIKWYGP